MKIITWNVNSIKARLSIFLEFLLAEKPDVVLLQELKCRTEAFPYQEIEDLGYNIAVHGQKTYNGVAILSKFPLSDVVTDFSNNPCAEEARYIEAIINISGSAIRVASVYVPNGQTLESDKYPLKLEFIKQLSNYYQFFKDEALIIGGDFNIALTDLDIYGSMDIESILYSSKERQALRSFIATGLIDIYRINKTDEGYTWWDYRAGALYKDNGMRIDYIFCSPEMAQINIESSVLKTWRKKEKTSDHAPVISLFSS